MADVKVRAGITRPPICRFSVLVSSLPLTFLCKAVYADTHDLQEIDAAGAGWWRNPHKTEAGGGLVADMGSHDTADKLGSSILAIWNHTWRTEEDRGGGDEQKISAER